VVLLIGGASLLATVHAVRRYRPSSSWTWWAVVGALLLFLIAGVARTGLHTLGNLTSGRSLVPDLIALPGYALLTLGLLGFSLARGRGRHRQLGIVLDGLIAALALFALAWVYLIEPELFHRQTPLDVRIILTSYPAMSIFLVVVTVRLFLSPDKARVPAYWLLAGAMTSMFVGDALYALSDSDLAHLPSTLVNLPYGLAYLAAGATALHRSMRCLTEPTRQPRESTSRLRFLLVAGALLIPAVLALRSDEPLHDRMTLSVIVGVLTIAATFRLWQAIRLAEHSEAKMAHQAMHDSLTGLPNRRMMQDHLGGELRRAAVDDSHVALLFVDIDRFKLINDMLGHSSGDEVIVAVADRLQQFVRSNDLVTRIGGDEFMIVLGDVVSVSQALELANRIRSCMAAPFRLQGTEFYITVSIGLSFASGDDRDQSVEVLMREADTAMHQAKEAGRDSIAIFDEPMRSEFSERLVLERDLPMAIERRELHLAYQPIFDLADSRGVSVEALARWSHPSLGVISPGKFIPLAEEIGRIGDIGYWVLDEALRQLTEWRAIGFGEDLYMSVNLSAAQLRDAELVDRVRRVLNRYELDGDSLCLELTESVVMRDVDTAIETLRELRMLGVRLAIDDFGTEYSSLAYLKRFPVTALKIDRSFVASLDDEDSADATLVSAIVAMAKALDIATIAEGVETPTQAAQLKELGCDNVQGFLYSRPLPAGRVLEAFEPGRASVGRRDNDSTNFFENVAPSLGHAQ
jgi:diguanylate cyclase (GGDEF)-like protein